MLIGLREALDYAVAHRIAIAAINVPFFEGLTAVIRAAEQVGVPVILQHAQVHEGVMAIEDIGPAMRALAERSPGAFVLHVDHAEDIEYVQRGFDVGFNSAMFDGSHLRFEENVARTAEVVALAGERGFGVEGELGVMTGNENGDPSQGKADERLYTDPVRAREFVQRTGVTALAASFGTVHGLYRREPRIDYELLDELRRSVPVPLVMHGGSGLGVPVYRECIARGVRKVNYYTYAAKAALDAARGEIEQPETLLFPKAAAAAGRAVEQDVHAFITALAEPR